MRLIATIDNKIDKDEALAVLSDYSKLFEKWVGIPVSYRVERKDFTNVPTVPDKDGDLKPTPTYRKSLEADVHKRYGDYGTDEILMWVHEDNFLYKGIWGSAWAYNFFKYSFYLCRWDKRNKVNTLYTLFHEGTHPMNTLILEELGIDINPLIKEYILRSGTKQDKQYVTKNGFDWDRDFVHGGLPSVAYIGARGYTPSKTNLHILAFIAPYLKEAYKKRKDKHEEPVRNAQKLLIDTLQRFIKFLKK